VGRARPACAGRAAIHTPGKVRRAEDCPPYQMRSYWHAPLWGAVNSALGGEPWSELACVHGFDLHRTLDDAEVVPPIKPKAVLEHRAPRRSVSALAHLRDSISHRKRHRVDLNCPKSNVLLASCRQMKLVFGRLGGLPYHFQLRAHWSSVHGMSLTMAAVETHGLMRPCCYHLPSWQARGRPRPQKQYCA